MFPKPKINTGRTILFKAATPKCRVARHRTRPGIVVLQHVEPVPQIGYQLWRVVRPWVQRSKHMIPRDLVPIPNVSAMSVSNSPD